MTLPDADAPPTTTSGLSRSVMLRLPEDLYEWLRTQAFLEHRSMNALGIEALLLLREQMRAPGQDRPGASGLPDPGST